MTDIAVRKYFSSHTDAYDFLHTVITRAGWQFWDEVSSTDKVYRTNGEEGKYPYIYFRIYWSASTLYYIKLYLYWDNVTHTGTTEAYYNPWNSINFTSSGFFQFVANKDIIGIRVSETSDSSNTVVIGFCNKLFYSNITNLTSGASLGDNVTLTIASSSGIAKGQKLQIVGVNTEGRDQLTVNEVTDANNIIVANLPRDYASGAFLGVTPCPAFFINCHWPNQFMPLCPRDAVGAANVTTYKNIMFPISVNYADPDYASGQYLFFPAIIGGSTSYDSITGYIDNDLVKWGYSTSDSANPTIFFQNDSGWPEQGVVTAATSNTITDSSKSWVVNEWAGKLFLPVCGKGVWALDNRYEANSNTIVSNTSNTLTMSEDFYLTPDATTSYQIVDKIYRFSASQLVLLEELHSLSASSCSSSSSSGSSSSKSSSSESSSSSSSSYSSSSVSSSSSSSSSLSSSSSSYSSSSSSCLSSSSSSSSSSLSSSSSSKSFTADSDTFYPAFNGDDGYAQAVVHASYNSVVVTSASGTFTAPTVYDWSATSESWTLTFYGTNQYYAVGTVSGNIGSAFTTNTQFIAGSYHYPLWAVFASRFGGTFIDGDTITFNTVAATLSFASTYTDVDGDRLKVSNGKDWFVKFDNVTIPVGAVVTSAFVRVTAFSNSNIDTADTGIRVVYDPVPTDAADFYHDFSREKGAVYVTWTLPAFTATNTYDSSDISILIQEALERSWVEGNDILLYFNGGGTVDKEVNSYEEGSGFVELHVEWNY